MKMIIKPDLSLDEIKDNLKIAFKGASEDTRHGLRFFSVNSYDLKNNAPESRMVVLRDFLPNWTFRFFTDFRSSKVSQIQKHPFVSLLFWNIDERYQVRLQAIPSIHHKNNVTESEWQQISGEAQKAYTSVLAPDTTISSPDKAHNWNKKHGDNYFCVIDAIPLQIKVLQLNGIKHLATKYVRKSIRDNWSGQWIVP